MKRDVSAISKNLADVYVRTYNIPAADSPKYFICMYECYIRRKQRTAFPTFYCAVLRRKPGNVIEISECSAVIFSVMISNIYDNSGLFLL